MASDSVLWFARHELRLALRESLAMLKAGRSGRSGRRGGLIVGLLLFTALMHLMAYGVVGRSDLAQAAPTKATLIVITASLALGWMLMLSQAIESVTRVFYTRADLDLIRSSPFALKTILSVRIAAVALMITAMALLIAVPFVDVLMLLGGPRWLTAYAMMAAIGISATAVAVAVTVALFRLCGPRRTRLVAQILSAIVGAGFVIALQVAAVISEGTLSRFVLLTSDSVAAITPEAGSLWWWPARAILGDSPALLALLAFSLVLLGATMALLSPRFGDNLTEALGRTIVVSAASRARPFRLGSPSRALRRKELLLLARDPWLVSQTLMQLMYLIPPGVMLWKTFDGGGDSALLLVPVLVMAAGQLAGGVAWLSISGEDAPDLIATAPLPPQRAIRAKIEVVLIVIGAATVPLLLPLAAMSPGAGLVGSVYVAVAAISSTAVQLWFRAQARRSQFRRRHVSSRVAIFAEAFSSIGWAATSALTLYAPLLAVIVGAMTLGVLALAWAISPQRT